LEEETYSLTVKLESIMLTGTVDAFEGRKVVMVDIKEHSSRLKYLKGWN
jgi:hypothetical protein